MRTKDVILAFTWTAKNKISGMFITKKAETLVALPHATAIKTSLASGTYLHENQAERDGGIGPLKTEMIVSKTHRRADGTSLIVLRQHV